MRLDEVMWPNKYTMDVFGLWSIRCNTGGLARRLFDYLRLILGTFGLTSILVTEVVTVTVYWGDIGILGDFGSLVIFHFLLTLKILYFYLHRRSFRLIYQYLTDFWDISDDPEERKYYEQPAKVARFVSFAFIITGTVNVLAFEATALVSWMKTRGMNESLHHRPLPLELYYTFDTQRSPIYEFVIVWQSFSGVCIISALVGFDCTVMVFIVHVSSQFKLVAVRFRAIGRKMNEQTIVKDDHKVRAEIGKCVAQHQYTIKVADELNALLSPLMFCQIVSSGMEICLGGYAVIEGDGGKAELVKFVTLFVTLLIKLVLWCAPAEILIQDSVSIAETIYYEMPWFKLTLRQQRIFGIVIMRAQKECRVTALYQIMSIRRITDVFNAAGSYLALLRSMKK